MSPLKMYAIRINFQLWTPVYSVIIKKNVLNSTNVNA